MARPKKKRTYGETIRFRVLLETETLIRKAAAHAAARKGTGDLSSWLREVVTEAAKRELKEEG